MNRKSLILLCVSFIIVLTGSFFITKQIMRDFEVFISHNSLNGLVKPPERSFNYLVFSQWFSLLFGILTLPGILWVLVPKWNISQQNWWKALVGLEVMGLLLSYLTTPPDLISTISGVILWQIPVAVNMIVCLLKINSMKKKQQARD